ncbi:T9SS type A sorting domain-containing protein [Flavivirga rizhaonensis]|uniref:T9SS type A sorting domain-containing protein n=1 Tax=Flavivirga rizhaonensis TaxID=2559571 RepID=A0A4V6R485_9FLAO|nr:T9SS type A sorting domain-containing protein [Flavivirga rizhaonensis]TGV03694.1 T9SS type A sorting domain-containing protein [Flavivirga rizhaonensis]
MKQNLLLIFLIPFFSFSQVQIGGSIDGEASLDLSGFSVSLSGDGSTLAIGTIGHNSFSGLVRVYKNTSGVWTQIGSDIYGLAGNWFGYRVSLSYDGTILAIGAPYNNNANGNSSGYVKVYEYKSNVWSQLGGDIYGKAADDLSGTSLSLSKDGHIVAIGAIANSDNGNRSGHVRVYEYKSNTWSMIGNEINGKAAGDLSGTSVSLSSNGHIIAIGATDNDNINGDNSGHVRIYKYENTLNNWEQLGDDIYGEYGNDKSGLSVSLSSNGSIVAIGATGNTANSGQVRVYENLSSGWSLIGNDIDGSAIDDKFGWSVSLSAAGSILAIGAPGGNGGVDSSGQVSIYKNISGLWKQIGSNINGQNTDRQFGHSVSLSADGSMVAISTPNNNNGGSTSVFDLNAILSSDSFVLSRFRISPNPATFQTTIKLNKGLILEKISIYNNLGQFILSTQKTVMNTSNLATGLYYVEVVTDKGKATKKLVIK